MGKTFCPFPLGNTQRIQAPLYRVVRNKGGTDGLGGKGKPSPSTPNCREIDLGEESRLQGSHPGVITIVGELISQARNEGLTETNWGLRSSPGTPELGPQRQQGMEAGWRHRTGPSTPLTGTC